MIHTFSLAIALYVFWVLLSGHYEPLLLILGILSCIVVIVIARRMDVIDRESHPLHLTTKVPLYWLWLLWQIVKANVEVMKLIWHPALPISPTVIRVKATQQSDLGRVIFANSITLTPGTVSMDVQDREIEVHALTKEMADDVISGVMDRKVSQLE